MPGTSSLSRRTALKTIGSAAVGTAVVSAKVTAASADMPVYIYPNRVNANSESSDARDAIDTALTEIVNNTDVGSKSLDIRYDHPDVADGSLGEFYNEFADWVESNYGSEQGCHIGVSGNVSGGRADGGNTDNPEDCAFVDQKDCVVGFDQPDGRFYNGAIQEVLHTYIDKNLDGVQEYLGSNNQEDELGNVTYFGDVTPMATGYTGDGEAARTGYCSTDYERTGYTQNVSYCTTSAVEATYNHWV